MVKARSGLSVGLAYWLFAIVAYGIFLSAFGNWELLSFAYHVLLLAFPVGLVLLGRERLADFGLKTGNLKRGIQYAGLIFIAMIASTFFRAFVFHRPVYLVPDVTSYSFFLLVIFAPITEELMHRGYLQPRRGKRLAIPKEWLRHRRFLPQRTFQNCCLPKNSSLCRMPRRP